MNEPTNRSAKWPWIVVGLAMIAGLVKLAFKEVPPPPELELPLVEPGPPGQPLTRDQLRMEEQQLLEDVAEPLPEQLAPSLSTFEDRLVEPQLAIVEESALAPRLTAPLDPTVAHLVQIIQESPNAAQRARAAEQLAETDDAVAEAIPALVADLLVMDIARMATNDLAEDSAWLALTRIDPDRSLTTAEIWKTYEQHAELQWDALWTLVHIKPADQRLFETVTRRLLEEVSQGNGQHARILMFLDGPRTRATIDAFRRILERPGRFEFLEMICPVVAMWRHGEPLEQIMPTVMEQYDREVFEASFGSVFLHDQTFNGSKIVKPFAKALLQWDRSHVRLQNGTNYLNVRRLVEDYVDDQ